MSYREHPPPDCLAGWIECVWTIRTPDDAEPTPIRVLPDGCADLIFDLGRPPRDETGRTHPWRSYAVGTMRSAKTFRIPSGAELLGVRILPGAARALLEAEPARLVDDNVGLDELWGRDAGRLEDALLSAPTRARFVVLSRELTRRFRPDRADPLVRTAFDLVTSSRGRASIGDLARAMGRSPRTLERRFHAATGIGPKEACRVVRLRHAVDVLESRPDLGGASLAARCGYADQPHLIREFRALAGETPKALREERTG